ncbi:MAG: MFS transporter [Thermoplasmatales archaeon]
MFSDSQEKIDNSFRFLLVSRSARSISLIFVTLAFSLYLSELGYSLVFIGLIFIPIILFNMAFSLFLGFLGDRIGYGKALIVGEVLPLIGLAGLTASTNIYVLATSAIITGITGTAGGMRGAFSPGTTAFIASNWPDEIDRVNKIAKMTVVASLSSIIGSLFLVSHGYLTPYFGIIGTFRLLFGVSFVILLISFVSLLFLNERKRPKKTSRVMKRESLSYLLRVLWPNLINGAAIGIFSPLLPLWFELRFHISVSSVGEVFTFAYAATALGSYISGRYLNSVRIRAITVSSVTRLFQGLILVLMAFSPIGVVAFGLYTVRSAVAGIGTPMRTAINVRGIGNEDYGTASSLQGVATRASQSTSGLSGYLMDVYLPSTLFIGGALQVIGAAVYYSVIRSWEKQRENADENGNFKESEIQTNEK